MPSWYTEHHPQGEFTVLGQGDTIVFRGWISPLRGGYINLCLSVAYIANNSRTQKPSVPKFGRTVPHLRCDSHTSFKVKGQGYRWAGAYRVGGTRRPHCLFCLLCFLCYHAMTNNIIIFISHNLSLHRWRSRGLVKWGGEQLYGILNLMCCH